MLTKLHVGQLGPRLARHIVPSRALLPHMMSAEMLNAASRVDMTSISLGLHC